ncbi:MAG TPA: acyl-CoA dehydrogenase family protein, partial [Acidimicrobiales bacterium]|nr:acyl-CoA dehydrogenase family protein [Acidimicrobiales bacterium]
MDLRRSAEQEQLVDAFTGLYRRNCSTERVRAAEPLGFDKALWEQLHELGTTAMAVDPAHGGWGATVLDLALVAEQHGRFVAPAPVIEAQVAARLLAAAGPPGAAALAALLGGESLVTVALHPAVAGQAGLVPAGAVADAAVVLVDDRLVLTPLEGSRQAVGNLGSMPLADVEVAAGAIELARGAQALALHDAALDDWLVLTAAALVGVGARGLELGVEYVKERKAWGVPIGTFQSVAHRLADSATALDGSRLLAYEAAWAADEDPGRAGELAAMAFAHAYESARDATYRSLHFHGGYGFMMEYDVQLHYRRARAWATVYAEP